MLLDKNNMLLEWGLSIWKGLTVLVLLPVYIPWGPGSSNTPSVPFAEDSANIYQTGDWVLVNFSILGGGSYYLFVSYCWVF